MSTASGIPDFRSADGLYAEEEDGLSPEMILSRTFFYLQPERFFDYYRKHLLYPDAKPNVAHRKLYELEQADKLRGIVTQNVDGLHKAAGNIRVYELHGNVHETLHGLQRGLSDGNGPAVGRQCRLLISSGSARNRLTGNDLIYQR